MREQASHWQILVLLCDIWYVWYDIDIFIVKNSQGQTDVLSESHAFKYCFGVLHMSKQIYWNLMALCVQFFYFAIWIHWKNKHACQFIWTNILLMNQWKKLSKVKSNFSNGKITFSKSLFDEFKGRLIWAKSLCKALNVSCQACTIFFWCNTDFSLCPGQTLDWHLSSHAWNGGWNTCTVEELGTDFHRCKCQRNPQVPPTVVLTNFFSSGRILKKNISTD